MHATVVFGAKRYVGEGRGEKHSTDGMGEVRG
jgi:hypothetical protein